LRWFKNLRSFRNSSTLRRLKLWLVLPHNRKELGVILFCLSAFLSLGGHVVEVEAFLGNDFWNIECRTQAIVV
ncbi:407_t:CDS:2, partial [Acaulospora morrowiae]